MEGSGGDVNNSISQPSDAKSMEASETSEVSGDAPDFKKVCVVQHTSNSWCFLTQHYSNVASMQDIYEALAQEDVHRIYAGVTLPNEASLSFHKRFGFAEVGTFHEVGRKFGKYWDVAWLEKAMP